jgi:hypothetical protein
MGAGSVQNRRTITSAIVVAAALLDGELRGGVFTFEQLMKKLREVLGRGLVVGPGDVQTVLPDMDHCLAKSRGGWQWKRRCREPGYLGQRGASSMIR